MSLHDEYTRKLSEIGHKFGFSTDPRKTPLGILDCVWRLKEPKVLEGTPVVAFEVLASEGVKGFRGSLMNMITSTASKLVFVLVKREMQKRADRYYSSRPPAERLKFYKEYLNRLVGMFAGIATIEIWNEEYVDKLWAQVIGNEAKEM